MYHDLWSEGLALLAVRRLVADYFFFKPKRADLPSRIACFVGLRLAEEVGRSRSMEELITLRGEALRQAIESGLRTLEKS